MEKWQDQAARSRARQLELAIAERAAGRRRLNATTVTLVERAGQPSDARHPPQVSGGTASSTSGGS